ncbi:hypothetical protein MHYP_G00329020 [Metynnis hypsauchen]
MALQLQVRYLFRAPGGWKVLRQRPLAADEGYCSAHCPGSASDSVWAEMWSSTANVSNRRAELTVDTMTRIEEWSPVQPSPVILLLQRLRFSLTTGLKMS